MIGTDPDADRMGVAVPDESGEYEVLTGNQTGALMLDYLLSQKTDLPENAIMIKTIVTSEFGRIIADSYDVASLDTLTGFKFIGEKIKEYEESGEYQFIFGYEESYGYLIKEFARDKDAVQAAMLSAELAAYWKSKGKTLLEALEELYQRHGYFLEDLQSIKMEGKTGAEKIQDIMDSFRNESLNEVGGVKVLSVEDYTTLTREFAEDQSSETINLPKANVLKFILEDNCWFCLRPSGTEPKIKFYFGVKSSSRKNSEKRLADIKQAVNDKLSTIV